MRIKLLPIPFFIGAAVGLASLACLGAIVQSRHLIDHFVRFHMLINVEAGYFPTARQVRAIVDKTNDDDQLVYVIVGGSSVFHGVGQHETLVWTAALQEHLGARFRVINFAQRAGSASDFGNVAAEYLLRNSKRVIYVADGSTTTYALALFQSTYRHMIFDAWERNFLLGWPPRDELLAKAPLNGPEPLRGPALGALLDAYLNFKDFWNFVVLEYMGLNWNWLLGERSFQARSGFKDPELSPEQYQSRRYYQDLEVVMRVVRSGKTLAPDHPTWQGLVGLIEQTVPPQLRAISLAVIDLDSPYYLQRLTAAEHEAYLQTARYHAEILARLGFRRVIMPSQDFSVDDYVDLTHFSVSGGQKLASAVAPAVQQMAIDLGYLK